MSDAPRILLIEDDPALRDEISRGLSAAGFSLDCAEDGARGFSRWMSEPFALVVLDLGLPKRDGWSLLEDARRPSTPVIVLTARGDVSTRVRAFSAGAVDYLAKPFFMAELVARVQARLAPSGKAGRALRFGEVEIDLAARHVSVAGQSATLTRAEFSILAYLVSRPGRAISRRTLADEALPEEGERSERTVDSHFSRLRQKLGPSASAFRTVWGIGWRFSPDE